jgi:hypothetical protein
LPRQCTRCPTPSGAAVIAQGEHLMLEWAGRHSAQVLAGYGWHLLAFLAPEIADAQDAEALARAEARDAQRNNTVSAGPDHRGRVRIRGDLDTESWAIVSAALEPFARPGGLSRPDGNADDRTAGQRSADALVEVCRRSRPIPRPVTGSPPMSPSPSATSS